MFEQFEASIEVVVDSEIGPIRLARPSLNEHIPLVLLGRDDFFASYKVRFDQRAMTIELEPYGDVPRKGNRQKKRRR